MPADPVSRILEAYPLLHNACRRREVRDPGAAPAVSAHQATVLAHLERRNDLTVTELAGLMGVALPTMSLLLERLVRGGWIRRDRDSEDGRRVLLRLTPAGERIRRTQSLLDPGRVRLLLELLTPAERAAGVEGLVTLARAARRLAGTPADSLRPSRSRGR
ncbi:MAG: MarR family transcriptional regulator [Gemmatimonadota bacterium]